MSGRAVKVKSESMINFECNTKMMESAQLCEMDRVFEGGYFG